jgi:Tfp pilus assembly protein PilX
MNTSKFSGTRSGNSRHQRGAALIVGLIMLLLLTLIGVAGMRDTLLQEKMAGNMRDREIALQAAESALRAGRGAVGVNSPSLCLPTPTACTTTTPAAGLVGHAAEKIWCASNGTGVLATGIHSWTAAKSIAYPLCAR